jgi:hypothetical protein
MIISVTNFEKIKNMSAEELAEFLDRLDCPEHQPWLDWGNEKFCKKCEPVMVHYVDSPRQFEVSPCDIGECPFGVGDISTWCLMWLNSED